RLLRDGMLQPDGIVIDGKSGVSGAGAKPTATVHYAHTEGSVRPYRVGSHQHTPEIELVLDRASGVATSVTFVPHLVPAVRGVLVTGYARLAGAHDLDELANAVSAAYEGAPFVRALAPGEIPDAKRATAGTVCEVCVCVDGR